MPIKYPTTLARDVELDVGAVKIEGDPHAPTLRDALDGYWRSRSRYSAVKLTEVQIAERVDLAVERIARQAVESLERSAERRARFDSCSGPDTVPRRP